MKAEYDLAKMKSNKNPYVAKLKKTVTMRLSEEVVTYFKIWRLRLVSLTRA
jgi:uncharacterized protein (DUF4415 family)